MWSQWDGCWGTRLGGTFREFCPDIYGPSYQNTAILSVKYSGYQDLQLKQEFHSHDFNQKDLNVFYLEYIHLPFIDDYD